VTQSGDNINAVVTFNPATLEAGKVHTVIARGTPDDTDAFDSGVRLFDFNSRKGGRACQF
jgi:hypothetical protein